MSEPKIPIARPWIGVEEREALIKPLETGWVVQGPYVRQFEEAFAAFSGAPHAAAASSCTTALHLAVAALGLKPGDEVIVPAFTWTSTANVVEYMGARPVFCDIDLRSFNIDVAQLSTLIGPRTVGIIPVHLFGLCADMDAIMALATRHRLWVVEDAACGFGARIRGQHAGTFGTAGAFSFHPRKAITTGEGGMVTTADAAFDTTIRSLRDHGASRSDFARHDAAAAFLLADYPMLGYNFRMTDMQGALGVAQMKRAAEILTRRVALAAGYKVALGEVDGLQLPHVPAGFDHGKQAYVCLFRGAEATLANVDRLHAERNRVMAALEAQGIATRQGTHAAALTTFYRQKYGLTPAHFPMAHLAEQLSLALPLFGQMTDRELSTVASALIGAMRA